MADIVASKSKLPPIGGAVTDHSLELELEQDLKRQQAIEVRKCARICAGINQFFS